MSVNNSSSGIIRLCVPTDYGPEEVAHLHPDGTVVTLGFKSYSNFENHPDWVCYTPANWNFENGLGITGQEFIDMCNGDALKALMIFSLCEWQHPSAVLEEWNQDDEAALETEYSRSS